MERRKEQDKLSELERVRCRVKYIATYMAMMARKVATRPKTRVSISPGTLNFVSLCIRNDRGGGLTHLFQNTFV